jgi:hypothetical protein
MPYFNPMRVLHEGLAREFAGIEESTPTDLESQPIIKSMKLAGEIVRIHRFTNFVPTPDTEGHIEEMPMLTGQGVGLIRELLSVRKIIDTMVADAISGLYSIVKSIA